MKSTSRLLSAFAFSLFHPAIADAGEHPLFSGPVQKCRGLSSYECDQAKRLRITKVSNTIRECERGILRYCDILLQIPDLSDAVRVHVEQVRASATARGGNSPLTQFLRRNTTEAPPGAYAVPQVTLRSGVPPGISTGYPAGVSTGYPAGVSTGTGGAYSGYPAGVTTGAGGAHSGYPAGVSTGVPAGVTSGYPAGVSTGVPRGVSGGVPDNVDAGVPDNVRLQRNATAGVPANVTAGTPARSALPATAAAPDSISAGVPAGVSSGSKAKGGVPSNVTSGLTAKSTSPAPGSTVPSQRAEKALASPSTTQGNWHSVAPASSGAKHEASSGVAAPGKSWKSIAPADSKVASLDASKSIGETDAGYRQSAEPVRINQKVATDVLPYAVLARDVDTQGPSEALFGFRRVDDSWQKILLQNGVSEGDIERFESAGFYGRVYKNDKTGEVVVAYRQSTALLSNPLSQDWKNDWLKTNMQQLAGATSPQYEAATKLAEATRSKYGNVPLTLTGFSKGGGQASYAGSVSDKVVTFNAARNPDAVGGYNRNQTNVIVPGDSVGDPHGALPAGVGSLPGTTVTVSSSEPRLVNDIKLGTEKHAIDGILGGLLDAAGGKYRTSAP